MGFQRVLTPNERIFGSVKQEKVVNAAKIKQMSRLKYNLVSTSELETIVRLQLQLVMNIQWLRWNILKPITWKTDLRRVLPKMRVVS